MTRTNGRTIFVDMTKGKDTKRNILEAGLKMATQLSLESVTIGNLAKTIQMSKSGLFAHFQSKENLQIQIMKYAGEIFSEEVVAPALMVQAGIPRIKALVDNWNKFASKMTGGCIFVATSAEFTDRPGKVRDFILEQQAAGTAGIAGKSWQFRMGSVLMSYILAACSCIRTILTFFSQPREMILT